MNKYTLFSMIGAGLLASSAAMAAVDPAAFQAEKDRQIVNMQERVQLVQERLACVQAATDNAALKVCNTTAKQRDDALEARIKAHRDDKKAARAAKKGEVAPAPTAPADAVPASAPTAPAMP